MNITLGYNSTLYTTSESRGIVELKIHFLHPPGGAPQPLTITVNTHNGTASSLLLCIHSCMNARSGSSEGDYGALSDEILQFNVGEMFQTHTIIINDDTLCENSTETFFSSISLGEGMGHFIHFTQPQAMIIIDDSEEAECSKFFLHLHTRAVRSFMSVHVG